jgi:hypothetical protein
MLRNPVNCIALRHLETDLFWALVAAILAWSLERRRGRSLRIGNKEL